MSSRGGLKRRKTSKAGGRKREAGGGSGGPSSSSADDPSSPNTCLLPLLRLALLTTTFGVTSAANMTEHMTVCKSRCSGDCKTYAPPLNACYNPPSLWPGDPQWGTERILDRCNATHVSRSFFAATDINCKTRTDGFDLPLGECFGPFGKPRPWGSFTCIRGATTADAARAHALAPRPNPNPRGAGDADPRITNSASLGVCDIYAQGGTPCVAAHSLTRALYTSYDGALYSVLNQATGKRTDVMVTGPGGVADITGQERFCGTADCIVDRIYDQSEWGNHLGIEKGFEYLGGPRDAQDTGVSMTADAKVGLEGGKNVVFGAVFEQQCEFHHCPANNKRCCDGKVKGYSNRTAQGTAVGTEEQTVYALFDGRHYSTGCCFEYGNAEKFRAVGTPNRSKMQPGAMEAVYYGCNDTSPFPNGSLVECRKGPYVYSDLETMHHMMTELPPKHMPIDKPVEFLAAVVKGKQGRLSLLAGNAQSNASEGMQTVYDGPYPADFRPSKKEGGIVLGVGGDNSPWGSGTWFEGVMTKGFSSAETDAAVFANVVAAGYVNL